MKIKNQRTQLSENRRAIQKPLISNKENIVKSDRKRDYKPITRAKSTFGEDITKRVNEPINQRYKFTVAIQQPSVKLPRFLKMPTAFNSEIAPYEEQIMEYIIQKHDQNEFHTTFKKNLKAKKGKRKCILQRLYNIFKTYKLRRRTLYLAIYYFDKYIRLTYEKDIFRQNLIGDACLLIAMKYEEIYPPLLKHWASGREKYIIQQESKILQAFKFKLTYTTAQHYLQIYQAKNPSISREQRKLHEIILDLYLFAGYIYDEHPLKIVQQVLESFRSTSFMEKGTNYEQSDRKVKQMIEENPKDWEFLIETDIYFRNK